MVTTVLKDRKTIIPYMETTPRLRFARMVIFVLKTSFIKRQKISKGRPLNSEFSPVSQAVTARGDIAFNVHPATDVQQLD